jgi:transcriptional regulator with XRE-family HTH domain
MTASQQQAPHDVIGVPVTTANILSSVPTAEEAETTQVASPPGVVGGTVLRAARLSAYRTQAQLAVAVGVDEASLAGWEDGTDPLTAVAYPVLERLEAELAAAGAQADLVEDLAIALWCDLVIEALAGSQDITCLMADPAAAEDAFGELLAWSVAEHRPARYRQYAGPGPLLRPAGLGRIAESVRQLGRGTVPGANAPPEDRPAPARGSAARGDADEHSLRPCLHGSGMERGHGRPGHPVIGSNQVLVARVLIASGTRPAVPACCVEPSTTVRDRIV